LKVLFDTNVLISAFISRGVCGELFEYCLVYHEILVPGFVKNEFRKTLSGKFKFSKGTVDEAVRLIEANTTSADHDALPQAICRDHEDDAVLAAAGKSRADRIVTGDEDLLVLKEFQGIPIIRPADFWRFEKEKK
jgi:putative PIN family toxin of toxin-antitoxin system